MYAVLTVIHVLSCIFLVLVVLLQTGKGADMGAVFGGSSSTVFGSGGAGNFLTRMTTGIAVVFMVTSLSLTYLTGRQTTATVFDSAPTAESAPAPGSAEPPIPAPPAAAPLQPEPPALDTETSAPPPRRSAGRTSDERRGKSSVG